MKYRKPAAMLAAALLSCALFSGCGDTPTVPTEQTTADTSLPELQSTVFEITEAFENIRVEGGISDVRIIPTPGSCSVGCTDIPGLQYNAQVEENTLVIREQGSADKDSGAEILICLTQPNFGTLDVSTTDGNVDIPLDFVFTDVTLRSVSGELGYRGKAEGVMSCTTESGRILVTDIAPDSLTMESSSGQIVAQSVLVDREFQANTDSGNIILSHIKCKDSSVASKSGSLSLEQLLSSAEMSISNDSGPITLIGCDGATIQISSVSGAVSGTVQTEKTFRITSESGAVSVPDTTGGVCAVTTVSGDVTLSIGGAA